MITDLVVTLEQLLRLLVVGVKLLLLMFFVWLTSHYANRIKNVLDQ